MPDIGPSRGGRRPSPEIIIEIIRPLTEEDLPKLIVPDALNTKPIPIAKLRASHHQLAQLLAQGRSDSEVSLITGYAPTRISTLKADPTFQELLASYTNIRSQIFVDTLERMKILGLSTLDELQERLEAAPEKWSNRELMEMADLMLVKSNTRAAFNNGVATGAAAGIAIQVQFVKSSTPPLTLEGEAINVPSNSPSN